MKEYKVVIYREPLIGSLILGNSKVDASRYASFLNEYAKQGWRVVTMHSESRREILFFKREAFINILERDVPQ